ncbi:hypothetical protein FHS96_004207 [Sphingomonas zeicaulis]|uniref:hypothetical protein n=1 Tax=Sphingomonas zeicaulis TaxID=1632740 RepID=UPI003D249D59
MAYVAFDEWSYASAARAVATATVAAPAVDDEPVFDALEERVIALAAADTRWSVRPRGVLGRLVERLFGFAPANPLADPRLEALRRFAVIARTSRGRPPEDEVASFLSAGFPARAASALSNPSS